MHGTESNQNPYINSEKEVKAESHLYRLIIEDALPVNILESENLKGFISKLNPKFRIPTRKEFIFKILPNLYAETSSAAKKIDTDFCIY